MICVEGMDWDIFNAKVAKTFFEKACRFLAEKSYLCNGIISVYALVVCENMPQVLCISIF